MLYCAVNFKMFLYHVKTEGCMCTVITLLLKIIGQKKIIKKIRYNHNDLFRTQVIYLVYCLVAYFSYLFNVLVFSIYYRQTYKQKSLPCKNYFIIFRN